MKLKYLFCGLFLLGLSACNYLDIVPEEVVKEGDAVTVKIIKVANGKVSLSIKALEDDKEAAKKAEETGVEYTEDAAGTSLGDLLANIKL